MTASRPSPRGPRPMAAGHVIVVVVIALLGGGLFNAQALTEAAARQPFGWKRTAAVIAATPFRGLSGLLGLDTPHRLLANAAVGTRGGTATSPSEGPDAANAPLEPTAEDAEQPGDEPSETPATTAPSESAESRATATRRDPLRVW